MEFYEAFMYVLAGCGATYLTERKFGYAIVFFAISIYMRVNM